MKNFKDSSIPWRNICLYCSKDLPKQRELKKYCSLECRKKRSQTDIEQLYKEFDLRVLED